MPPKNGFYVMTCTILLQLQHYDGQPLVYVNKCVCTMQKIIYLSQSLNKFDCFQSIFY
jgi:hypothetical protein